MPRLLAFVCALFATACAEGSGPRHEGPYRHVLLISLDTFRADHMGCQGASRPTPALDALAAEGTRFADTTAPAPTTLVSHTSLMTGSWPHTHGVVRNGFVLSEENVMLAELLGDAGFHTAGFLGSFALESRFGFDQGFAHFDEQFDVLVTAAGNDQNQRRAGNVTRAVLEHVDRVADEVDRLFLFAHYFDAHLVYEPPPAYAAATTGDPDAAAGMEEVRASVRAHQERRTGRSWGHSGVIMQGFLEERAELLEAPATEPGPQDLLLADLYAGEVAYVDDAVGDLLEGLDQRGILDETVVVLTGDHGETFWEHGDLWNHGLWLYQTTVQVPLVLRLPDGRGAGLVVDAPVSTVDVVPTLCELLQLELPPRCEGVSLAGLVEGRALERGPVFSEANQPWKVDARNGWTNRLKPQSVRLGRFKYVHAPYNGVEQLFDLGQDPGEQNNLLRGAVLAPVAATALEELRRALEDWRSSAAPLPSSFDRSQYDETVQRLQELGYLGEDSEPEESEEER